jgi:DNA repair exonuclease SbcCD nuclease subunit
MKLAIFSDIHLEDKNTYQRQFNLGSLVVADAKECVALIAGDLSHKPAQVVEALRFFANHYQKVVFTYGNHEFYRTDMHSAMQLICEGVADLRHVHILNNQLIQLQDNLYIWGGTLWTDFNDRNYNDMFFAKNGMNDFRLIKETADSAVFTPEDSVRLHHQAMKSLTEWIEQIRTDGQTQHSVQRLIVMTHHAPTYKGTAKEYQDSPLNPAFSSHLDAFIEQHSALIPLWVHGHKHNAVHEWICGTQIVCHPMGYRDEGPRNYAPKVMVV